MPINLSDQYISQQASPDDALVNLVQHMQIELLGHGSKKSRLGSSRSDFVIENFLIIYVLSGSARLQNKGSSITLKAGSFFLLLPFEVYRFSQSVPNTFRYIYIYFNILPLSVNNIFKKHTLLAGKNAFRKNWYRQIGIYLAELCQPVYQKNAGYNFLLRHVIEGIIAYILHEPLDDILVINYKSTTKDGTLVDLTFSYTMQHLHEPVNIARLAQELATSRSTLNRVFQHVMNLSPSQAVTRFKIHHSLESLKKGVSIKELALSLGYSSPSHFSRAFRSVMNLTPTEYILK